MIIDKQVIRNVPLSTYGFTIFLVVNVYFLWGVALPTSHAQTLVDYDAIIQPFRICAGVGMAFTPLLILVLELSIIKAIDIVRKALLPIGALASVAGLLFFVSAVISVYNPILFVIAGLLVGIGNSCCFLLWGVVLTRMQQSGCIYLLLLSGPISGTMNLVLFSVPSTLGYPIVAILLVISLFGLQKALSDLPEISFNHSTSTATAKLKKLFSHLGQPLLCVCALGLAFNAFREVAFAQVGTTSLVNTVSMGALIVSTGIVLAVLIVFKVRAPEVNGIYPLAMLVVAACMIPFPFVGKEYSLVFVFIISAFYLLVETLFKGAIAQFAREEELSALLCFGFGFGVEFTVMAIGSMLGMVPRADGSENQVILVFVVVLICMYLLVLPLLSVFIKKGKRSAAGNGSSDIKERIVIRNVGGDELRERCEAIAEDFGVTQSELSTLVLLAAGQTVPAISQELTLSENTIRSHSKSIYRKLDVHSKQELIALVANYDCNDEN